MAIARDPDGCPPGGVLLAFRVNGECRPQGSKTQYPVGPTCPACHRQKLIMAESSSARLKAWRKAITEAAREAWAGRPPLDQPIELGARFLFERPKSHLKKAGGLRKGAPMTKQDPPDLSKLVRALEDALTDAGVWSDDGRVCRYRQMFKGYTRDPGELGADVVLYSYSGGLDV